MYPFGMQITERTGSSDEYRYGFNGKENDNEIMGQGNFQDYGMRSYNPRIGRFFTIDPLAISYPNLTPYQYASNSPIANTDLDGLESLYFQITHDKNTGKSAIKLADIKTSYLDKILPYHVVVSVDGGEYMYAGDYALSFEGQRKALTGDLKNYAKNPQAAVRKFTQMKEDAEIAHQENVQFWGHDIWVDGVTAAWASNIKKGTYTETNTVSKQSILLKDKSPQIGTNFEKFSVNIKEGKININGRSVTNGKFDFVVDAKGNLSIGSGHYNLSGGSNTVQAAGEIKIYKGKVTSITNSSGHYKPSAEEAANYGKILTNAGVDVQGASLKVYNPDGALKTNIKL